MPTAQSISTSGRRHMGQELNWIQTPAGTGWFPRFRFYGPEKTVFDKSWKMPDIERMS